MIERAEAVPLSTELGVDIPEIRSDQYRDWIEDTAARLSKELPFIGKADITVVLGSGLNEVWQGLDLKHVKQIKDSTLVLPFGKTAGHDYEWIAGIASNGKKVLVKSGRVGAIEPDPMGTKTEMGRLSNVEMATAYLRVLDEIGTDILITTHASGGIAHPQTPYDAVPFHNLPQIALITNHIDHAFIHPLLGPKYNRDRQRFHGPKYADRDLMSLLEEALMVSHGFSPLERVTYHTSNTSPEYEDEAYIQNIVTSGGGVFGMTLGPEKRVIDDCLQIYRFMNLAVVTNSVQLRFRGGNDELLDVRRKLNDFLWWHMPIGPDKLFSQERERWERGEELIPSALDLDSRWAPAHRLEITHPANHLEVMEFGRRAIEILKSGINGILYGDPRVKYLKITSDDTFLE